MKLLTFILLLLPIITFSQYENVLKSLEKYEVEELDNGMKVILVQTDEYNFLSYRFILDFQPFYEEQNSGAMQVLSMLLGSELNSRTQLKKDMISDVDAIDSLLKFMSFVLLRPDFNEATITKIKKFMADGTSTFSNNFDTILSNKAKDISFSKNHPYHEVPTENTYLRLSGTILKKYHSMIFNPQNAYLILVGDLKMNQIITFVDKYFGKWTNSVEQEEIDYQVNQTNEAKIFFQEFNDLSDAYISINYPIEYKIGQKDYLETLLLSEMFLQHEKGIIYDEIVDKEQYSDYIITNFSPDYYQSFFNIQVSTKSYDLEDYIDKINEVLTDFDDLALSIHFQNSKQSLQEKFEKSFLRPYNVAQYAYNLEKYELSNKFYSSYSNEINKISPQKLIAVAEKYFSPQKANYVIFGNSNKLFCSLQKLAKDYSIEQMTDDDNIVLYDKGFGHQSVIDSYLKLNNSNYYFSNLSISFDADYFFSNDTLSLKGKILRKNEELFKYQTSFYYDSLTTLHHQLEIYDGDKWLDSTCLYFNILEKNNINSKLYKTFLFPEKFFDKLNYSVYLACDKELFDKNIYKIIILTPFDTEFHEYYDIETKQKIKTEKIVNDEIFETYEYFDFQALENNVTIPFKIIQTSKNFKIILKITEIDYITNISFNEFKIKD